MGSTVNERPLVYVSKDSADVTLLTAAMLLVGIKNNAVDDFNQTQDLRSRFKKEYLRKLASFKGTNKSRMVALDSVVLVEMGCVKRFWWPFETVTFEMIPGRDKIWLVEVKVGEKILTRSYQRNYPLEVR